MAGNCQAVAFPNTHFIFIIDLYLLAKVPELIPLNEILVDATIKVYSTITSCLLPTPAKSHYTFNLRDLSKVFQGVLMADPGKIQVEEKSLRSI